MTYRIPESKRSIGQNRFYFEMPDGTEVSMPKAKYLTMGQIETLAGNADEVKFTDVLELFQEEESLNAVRQLDKEQLEGLLNAWQQDSGLALGESSASS